MTIRWYVDDAKQFKNNQNWWHATSINYFVVTAKSIDCTQLTSVLASILFCTRYGLFPLPYSDSDSDSVMDSCTMQDFSICSYSDSDPLIEIYVVGMEICPWNRDLSLKWVQNPFRKGIQIQVRVSGNMFCIILCSHRVWNPSPNPYTEQMQTY